MKTAIRPAHLNPFRVQRTDALLYQPEQEAWLDAITRLKKMNWHGAVVGPHGSGKTTLLRRLAGSLSARGLTPICIRLGSHRPRADATQRKALKQAVKHHPETSIILLDGAEQLSWISWKQFLFQTRRVAGLVVTTHAPGRLPTWFATSMQPSTFAALANQLLHRAVDAGEIDSSEITPLSLEEASALLNINAGNARDAFRMLYEQWAC